MPEAHEGSQTDRLARARDEYEIPSHSGNSIDRKAPHLTDRDGTSYASFGSRLAAWLLDCAILLFVLLLVGVTVRILQSVGVWAPARAGLTFDQAWKALGPNAKPFVLFAFVVAMGPVYFVLFEASPWQATIGKRFLNLYVTSDDRKRISIGRAVGRWVVKLIVGRFGMAWFSVITILATKERKGVHDAVANTLVLRGQPVPGGALEAWRIAAALGFPFAWILGSLLATL